ncbi:MAG: type II toxin-antitoxin system VapC family toxin [Alphaproteobacteria bacterium]|nr:type II toxin-antitoxin system VapC family toxin [Alphaproteobacteria bacterium]
MYLLDTNIVSETRRGSSEATAWIRSVKGRTLHVSVITLGEIMRGIQLKERKDPKAAAILAEWLIALRELDRETVLPVTEAVALDWGRLSADRSRNTADGLIAATARVHDLILVTRNVTDFEDTGVSIINPWNL